MRSNKPEMINHFLLYGMPCPSVFTITVQCIRRNIHRKKSTAIINPSIIQKSGYDCHSIAIEIFASSQKLRALAFSLVLLYAKFPKSAAKKKKIMNVINARLHVQQFLFLSELNGDRFGIKLINTIGKRIMAIQRRS